MREKDMTPQASTLTPITRAACIFETWCPTVVTS
jgi:hypothetical protein